MARGQTLREGWMARGQTLREMVLEFTLGDFKAAHHWHVRTGSGCSSPTDALREVKCAVQDMLMTIIEGARMTIGCTEEDVWKTNGEIMSGKTKIARVVLSTSSRIAR